MTLCVKWLLLVALAVCLLPSLGFGQELSQQEKDEGFVSLFNGQDTAGWLPSPAKGWGVKDGILYCTGEKGGAGWLRSEKEYEDFILRIEWRLDAPGGNSGIFIRATEKGNPAFTGMEVQILGDHGKPRGKGSAGALYAAVAPSQDATKPEGEWNAVEITCIGKQVKTVMNGVTLYDIQLDDPKINEEIANTKKKEKRKQADGTEIEVEVQQYPLLTVRVPKGFIGMQNHGHYVGFRNIRIKPIK